MPPTRTSILRAASALGVAAFLAVPSVASAASVTANETVSAGSLAFINSTPASPLTFSAITLNGTSSQTATATQNFDVDDATGSGNGWDITATSTTFKTSGGATLGAPSIASTPSDNCDSAGNCTTVSPNTNVTYAYTIPAGSTAPTATKMYSAPANSGMGAQTISAGWTLPVPENAMAGAYSSTWTLSLVSGP